MKETKLNKIITKNLSARVSDTVISSLRRDEAHAVVTARLGHLAHLGPLVCIGIIIQHFGQYVGMVFLSSCNDVSSSVIKHGRYGSKRVESPHLRP